MHSCSIFFSGRVGTETLAITGALALCLFPADTTHSFLTHSLSLQVSVTFLLTASLLYLSGKRISPYVVIVGSLLTYESPYMVFLAIPLLRTKWDKALVKELFRHVAIMAGIVLVAVVIRIIMGEGRIGEMRADILGILAKIASALVIGPAVSMTQFFNAPIRAVLNWNNMLTVVSSACVLVFAWMLYRSGTVSSENRGIEVSANQKQVAGMQSAVQDDGRRDEDVAIISGGRANARSGVCAFFYSLPARCELWPCNIRASFLGGGRLVDICLHLHTDYCNRREIPDENLCNHSHFAVLVSDHGISLVDSG